MVNTIIISLLAIASAVHIHREMLEVNTNYLDFVNDLALKKDMHYSRLKPKGYHDAEYVGQQSSNMGEAGMEMRVGLDLKDDVKLRVNLES